MRQLLSELQDVFRRVLDDDSLVLDESTSAAEVDGWDSMAQINLIIAIEKRFGIKFMGAEMAALGRQGQNIGSMLQILESKIARRRETDAGKGP